MRTATYGLIGYAFIGTCWQWELGSVLVFGGEEPARRATLRRDLAGVAVLVVTSYLALHGWDY